MNKFAPPSFPVNPSPEQWRWGKQCFIKGLEINSIDQYKHKLTILRTHAGSELYSLLSDSQTFQEAINILNNQFDRPSWEFFARHQLLSCKQRPEESLSDFVRRLNIQVEKCNCNPLIIRQHKDSLLRDALVSGISSDAIRARLLELDDSEASLSDCIARASAVEIISILFR